jgi:hypothetical protein
MVRRLRRKLDVKAKIRHALNEARILILGTQVLLGFQYRSVLEPRFEHLPTALQWLSVAGLGLLIVTFGLLVAPAAYHRIVERGVAGAHLHRFTTRAVGAALLPLAVALGGAAYLVAEHVAIGISAPIAAAIVVAAALGCWYAIPLAMRRAPGERKDSVAESPHTSLDERIEHVLTEIRMVLPGAQALLGFGVGAVLMESFDHLPQSSQLIHLIGVGFVMLATILLMTPASRHRITERGEVSEAFHRFTSYMLLAAMAALALGVAAQALVVVRRVHGSLPVGAAAAALALLFCWGLWFGLTTWLRGRTCHVSQRGPPTNHRTKQSRMSGRGDRADQEHTGGHEAWPQEARSGRCNTRRS